MYLKTNLKVLRARRRLTQEDVSRALDLNRSTLNNYENGIAEPGIKNLLALSAFFRVTIDTLVKIDLSALSDSQLRQIERGNEEYITGKDLRILAITVNDKNENTIELVPEKAKAGYMTGYADPEFLGELPRLSLPFLSKNTKHRVFQVSGDSMLPVQDKSWVIASYCEDWSRIKNGEACVILTEDQGILFKVVQNRLKKDQVVELHSLNPIYKPLELNASEVREIWKFAGFISPQMPGPEPSINAVHRDVIEMKLDLNKIIKKLS